MKLLASAWLLSRQNWGQGIAFRNQQDDLVHKNRVKDALKSNCLSLARKLAPDCAAGGGVDGDNYFALNPTRNDRSVGSFFIAVQGPFCGGWFDKATGDEGDVFQFIGYIKGWHIVRDFGQIMQWAEQWLGMSPGEAVGTKKRSGPAPTRKMAEGDVKKPFNAKGAWLAAERELLGTDVDRYLQGRDIALTKLARLPGSIRFASNSRYYHHSLTRELHDEYNRKYGLAFDGRLKRFYTVHPAMVSAMVSADNQITCVHRTFLAVDGQGKADVPKPKKMRGEKKGSAIRLARGRSSLTEKQAIAKGEFAPLCLVEGIEDGLVIAVLRPDWRVWAVGDVGNFRAMDWPLCAREIILIGDNDDGQEALASFEAAKEHYARRAGDNVLRATKPPLGTKDMNTWLCHEFEATV